jgi:hypothetical protein
LCIAAGCTVNTLDAPPEPSRRSQKSHQKQQPPPVNCEVSRTRIFAYWKLGVAAWLNWLQVMIVPSTE